MNKLVDLTHWKNSLEKGQTLSGGASWNATLVLCEVKGQTKSQNLLDITVASLSSGITMTIGESLGSFQLSHNGAGAELRPNAHLVVEVLLQ